MPQGKFPSPYVNTVTEDDPLMERVHQDKLDIGARASGMPRDSKNGVTISHVGSST